MAGPNDSRHLLDEQELNLFTEMLIDKIKKLNTDWKQPWFTNSQKAWPQNISGYKYKGKQALFILLYSEMKNYKVPLFMTFNQVKGLNYKTLADGSKIRATDKEGNDLPYINVMKGEKSLKINFKEVYAQHEKTKERITFQEYKDLSPEEQQDYKVKTMSQPWTVFNIDQTNMKEVQPELYEKLVSKILPKEVEQTDKGMYSHPVTDTMIANQQWICPIKLEYQNKAFYSLRNDSITLPEKKQFDSGEAFYGTLFHEMTHSTGKAGLLDRLVPSKFGDSNYAKEELVAELTSALVCYHEGISKTVTEDTASYLKEWLNNLKEDPDFLKDIIPEIKKAYNVIDGKLLEVQEKIDKGELQVPSQPLETLNAVKKDNSAETEVTQEQDYYIDCNQVLNESERELYNDIFKEDKGKSLDYIDALIYDNNLPIEKASSGLPSSPSNEMYQSLRFTILAKNGENPVAYRRLSENEMRELLTQQGIKGDMSQDVHNLAKKMVDEQFKEKYGPVITIPNHTNTPFTMRYDPKSDAINFGLKTQTEMSTMVYSYPYVHTESLNENIKKAKAALPYPTREETNIKQPSNTETPVEKPISEGLHPENVETSENDIAISSVYPKEETAVQDISVTEGNETLTVQGGETKVSTVESDVLSNNEEGHENAPTVNPPTVQDENAGQESVKEATGAEQRNDAVMSIEEVAKQVRELTESSFGIMQMPGGDRIFFAVDTEMDSLVAYKETKWFPKEVSRYNYDLTKSLSENLADAARQVRSLPEYKANDKSMNSEIIHMTDKAEKKAFLDRMKLIEQEYYAPIGSVKDTVLVNKILKTVESGNQQDAIAYALAFREPIEIDFKHITDNIQSPQDDNVTASNGMFRIVQRNDTSPVLDVQMIMNKNTLQEMIQKEGIGNEMSDPVKNVVREMVEKDYDKVKDPTINVEGMGNFIYFYGMTTDSIDLLVPNDDGHSYTEKFSFPYDYSKSLEENVAYVVDRLNEMKQGLDTENAAKEANLSADQEETAKAEQAKADAARQEEEQRKREEEEIRREEEQKMKEEIRKDIVFNVMPSAIFYASVAYLQSSEEPGSLNYYHERGEIDTLLSEAAMYDQGDAINLDETYSSPTQMPAERVIAEDKYYAVTYDSAAGGVYDVYRKVTADDIRDTLTRYGGTENMSPDVMDIAKEMVREDFTHFMGESSGSVVMPNEEVVYFDYDPRQDAIIAGGMTNAGLIPEHTFAYDHSSDVMTNLSLAQEELLSLPRYQAEEQKQEVTEGSAIENDYAAQYAAWANEEPDMDTSVESSYRHGR